MLNHIEFINTDNQESDFENDYNLFGGELTENTIVLCDSYNTMNTFHKRILEVINNKDSEDYSCNYFCEDEDINHAETILCFGLQRVIKINNQTITLALEPSIIYKANEMEDIWFIEKFDKYKILPMSRFKGSKEKWLEGKDAVYKYIVNGRYGCYDGKWTNLSPSRIYGQEDRRMAW